jgi:hypothetical protein
VLKERESREASRESQTELRRNGSEVGMKVIEGTGVGRVVGEKVGE